MENAIRRIMAKTRQVQWEQNKLHQLMMEADAEEAANSPLPRSIANGGTPHSFGGRTTRSMALDSSMSSLSSPASVRTVNTMSSVSQI